MLVVPHLRGRHRQLLEARIHSVEQLVSEAQLITEVEVLIVVEEKLDHIALGVIAGGDAITEVYGHAPWAACFMTARPWVPVLIVDLSGGRDLAFAAAGREPLGYLLGVRRHGGYPS